MGPENVNMLDAGLNVEEEEREGDFVGCMYVCMYKSIDRVVFG